ncbi:MAG: SRPBCC family protein [Chloroflexota bacterium]
MKYTYSLDINAPIEQVFDLVEVEDKLKMWMDNLVEMVYPTPLDRRRPVGTRFIQRVREGGRIGEYEGVVTAYERPYRLTVEMGNKHFTTQVDYQLTAIPGGTHLDYTADTLRASALARRIGKTLTGVTQKALEKQMLKLKAAAEGS